IYAMQKNWEAAIPMLEKASRMQPSNPDPLFQLGQAYQSTGKVEQALDALKKSIALNPSFDHNNHQVATAHYQLGQALIKAGRTEEGEKELEIAADLKAQGLKRDEAIANSYLNSASLAAQSDGHSEAPFSEGLIEEGKALDDKTVEELKRGESYYSE